MPSHVSHHRRAKVLLGRKAAKVHVLDERFSPTATFAEMTELNPPDTVIFPPIGHGHHRPTEITPVLPPLITPDPPTTTTPIVPIIPITRPNTPTVSTLSTSSTDASITAPTSTSSSAPATTPSPAVPTTSFSVVTPDTSIVPDLKTVTTLATRSPIVSAAASASSPPSASSGLNTGAVVGGVGAGVAAVVAIAFAVIFFVRRVRKRREEAIDFSPHDFRRSAVLLSDPPTHEDTVARGYNPPPPPGSLMMQQHQQAPVSASIAGYNEPYYGQERAAYGSYHQYQEQYPSQGAFATSTLSSPTSSQRGAAITPYGLDPFASNSSLPSPHELTAVATSQPAGMIRQLTADAHPPPPSLQGTQVPANDYVDLSRSSVSPFQAAQYAEISRRLEGLPTSPVVQERFVKSAAELYATQQKDLPAVPPPPHSVGPSVSDRVTITQAYANSTSPPVSGAETTDQATAGPIPLPRAAVVATSYTVSGSPAALPSPPFVTAAAHTPLASPSPDTLSVQTSHLTTLSTDSFTHEPLEFPVPPSPALSYSSRYRVDSPPPTLPEIIVQSRSSVSSYIPQSPMIGSGYISGISNMSGASGVKNMGLQSLPGSAKSEGKFVPTKSPLASSMVVVTPTETNMSVFAAEQDKALRDSPVSTPQPAVGQQHAMTTASASTTTGPEKEEKRTTVYNPDDAYGGF